MLSPDGRRGHAWEAINRLPTRGDWPAGATSADIEQLVLMGGYLTELE